MTRHFFPASMAFLVVFTSLAQAASLQPEYVIEEILVTASFHGDELRLVPSSISVVSEETISKRNVQHFAQLLNMIPNVNYAYGASRGRFLQIRGVGERSQFKDPLDASVGLVVDGIDFSGIGLIGTMFDVQQLEVLRGPQGTAFGSNAMAGLVFVKSNDPTEKFEGSVVAGAGNYGMWQTGVVLSGPLKEGLLGRLSVHTFQGDGYIDNEFLRKDDVNNFDELTVRAKLQWDVSEDVRIGLTALHIDADNGYDAFSLENNRHTGSDEPGHDRQESDALSVNIVSDSFDNFRLEVSAFLERSDLEYGFDWDWSNLALSGVRGGENNARERDSHGLDVRLTSKQGASNAVWVVGAYLYERDVKLDYSDHWEDFSGVYPSTFNSKFETQRRAIYGQFDWMVVDRLFVSIGARFEKYEDSYADSANVSADPNDGLWGGRASLEYRTSDNSLVYGSISRGYKTGGVNGQAVAAAVNDPTIDPAIADFLTQRLSFDTETLTNYEIGFRGSFFDNALAFSASAFLMEREDMQAKAWVLFPPADWKSYVDNVDDGENRGVEIEASLQASEQLRFAAGLGILDTELGRLTVQDIDTGLPLEQDGREQAHAPAYQFFVSANYEFNPNYFVNVQLEGKDEYFFSNSHNIESDAYHLVHLTAGYDGERLAISVWGRNLLDEDYHVRGFYFANNPLNGWVKESYLQLGEPRSFGVTARYDF